MICNAHNSLIFTPPQQTGGVWCIESNSPNVDLSDALLDTHIRRYLNLNHFIDMMECNRLYVNRRKVFKDKNEHYLTFKWPGFLMPVGDNIPPQPDKTDYCRDVRDEYSKWVNMPTVCWTLSHNESYLMWKGYTEGIGVCIVSSIRRFISSIQKNNDFDRGKCIVHCGQMIYNSYSSLELDSLPFWKGREYASENELRFYFENPEDRHNNDHIYIPIDVNTLIEKIILTPFVHCRTANALAEMIQNKYGIIVSPSNIYTNEK